MVEALERRHPDLYASRGEAAFAAEVERARAAAPEADEPGHFLNLMRVLAMADDSHTRMATWAPIEDLRLPVLFGLWQDEYWIEAVQPDLCALFARRLVAIGDHPVSEVEQRLAVLVPHENRIVLGLGAAQLMSVPRALRDVGVVDRLDDVRLTLRALDGTEQEVRLAARPSATLEPWAAYAPEGWSDPLYRTRMGDAWWWTELDGRALYFQYNSCRDGEDPTFAELAREMLTRLDQGDLAHIVIDLRLNSGGDSRVLRPLIDGLERRPEVRATVLIGTRTYSSGMLNAWQLQRRVDAELVGEPTAQKPNCFGDPRAFELPNSGIRVDCSTKTFRPVPGDPSSLFPGRSVVTTFEDVYRGRDPVLAAVAGARPRPPPGSPPR